MMRIAVQVEDAEKAELLLELLSSIDFIKKVDIETEMGQNLDTENANQNPLPSMDPNRPAMLREQTAFDEMKSALIEKYLHEYVAVFQGQVVDHDADELALLERRNERFPDDTVLIKFVSEAPDPLLRFRSPRFIQE